MIVESDLQSCPEIVIRYLTNAGVVGNTRKKFAHMTHDGEFRLKPNQKWMPIHGEYFFKPEVPSFVWKASIKIFPMISITVVDQYQDGVGYNEDRAI